MSSISVIRPRRGKKDTKKKSPKSEERRKKRSRSASSSSSSSSSRSRSPSRDKDKDKSRSSKKPRENNEKDKPSNGGTTTTANVNSTGGGQMGMHPDRTALIGLSGQVPDRTTTTTLPNTNNESSNSELPKLQEGGVSNNQSNATTESEPSSIPPLEPSEPVVIFHQENSGEVITVDGSDQKDERKRDRERRRPSGRDRARDRDRDRDRRGYGSWSNRGSGSSSRRDRDRDRDRDSKDSQRRDTWSEFQKRQRNRQNESRTIKRSRDPSRDTTYDYLVPQNYLYDDRSYQDYESTKRRLSRKGGGGGGSPDRWTHDKFDPNEPTQLPEDGDANFDRWALNDS